ncbi:bifunctional diguanylate cyclase/phosphodiesterase [Pseudoalteromonas sp. BZB3]|uniref:putative bifunctional diguanylate cyclase/phosphodiesterase n=1 Tax=Pseudoalteromonas sp. BZB3 TaxID=3136670 RepID=UPI0032C458F9
MNRRESVDYSSILGQIATDKVKRLKSFILLISLSLALFFILNILIYQQGYAYTLVVALGIFLFLHWFVCEDTLPVVSGIFIWTLTLLAFFFAWNIEGLYDTSLLAYPCILVFCAMLNSRLLIISTTTFMVLSIYCLAYAEYIGLLASPLAEFADWRKAHNMALVLLVFASVVYLLTKDIDRLLERLVKMHVNSLRNKTRTQRKALTNRLTLLPNEIACAQYVQGRIYRHHQAEQLSALMVLTLNNLNSINASLGFDIGDKLINMIAQRLNTLSEDNSKIFHSSNNQFFIFIDETDYHDIEAFAHQALQTTFFSNYVEQYEVEVSACIGIAIAPHDGNHYDALLRRAHTALTKAVQMGHNQYAFFDLEMEQQSKARLAMLVGLKRAIEQQEFELYYQPKIELSSNTIAGVEALIRWRLPDNTLMPSSVFIPVAEASGLINEIGIWVVKQAVKDCLTWHQLGFNQLGVSVNASAEQFKKGNFGSLVLKTLKQQKLDPSYLDIEITESLFIEDEKNIQAQIHQMVSQGISISIDDFGTGYSNLNYLTKFNASTLKIDQSFIKNMMHERNQYHLVDAILKMSHAIGIENIAEGIEDKSTANILMQLGCRYGQGYYWSKPIPQPAFCRFLINWQKHSIAS